MSHFFKAFAPISKVDDEQRMVYGYASTDTKDSQGDIVKLDAIEAALPDYMKFANIREMHTMSAVGVAKSAEVDNKGLYLAAKVVDDTAWTKVKEGVYKGFSIGGKALKKSAGVIEELRLTEISLVDRPANTECVIDMWKAEGGEQPNCFANIRKAASQVSWDSGKPIWDASRAIEAMSSIFYLMLSEAGEQEQEPEQLAQLQTAINSLKAFVISELQEKTENGAPVTMGAGADNDISKAGATYSKATKAALSKLHGMIRECDKMMKGMGYDADDMGKAEGGTATVDDELKKAAQGVGITVAAEQSLSDLVKAAFAEITKSKARITELEAQPAPAKAAITAVGKTDDTQGNLVKSETPAAAPNDPLAIFKAALSQPLNMVGHPISKPSSVN